MIPNLRTYSVNPRARAPLIDFMTGSLVEAGCRILHCSPPNRAPFVIAFETSSGERMGIIAYAFLATRTLTKNRPANERSFQMKYGSKKAYADKNAHDLWQDPLGMFTTLLVGIDPKEGFCVSADPMVHSPTKFFIRLEFKDEHADAISRAGWHAWERIKRQTQEDPLRVETLVGAKRDRFLDLVRFERASRGLEPGNRLILAEKHTSQLPTTYEQSDENMAVLHVAEAHPLVRQFELSSEEILDLIAGAKRLKMAVRGWVAEEHLRAALARVPGVTHCERLDEEGGPDLRVAFKNGPMLTVECKNVSRDTDKEGRPRIDFQRTRAAKGNPCSRYYKASDFDVVAACLHAITETWEFQFAIPGTLPAHKKCEGRLSSNIRVTQSWTSDVEEMFRRAYSSKGLST